MPIKLCKKCGGIAEWNSYYGGVTCTRCGYVDIAKPTHYDILIRKSPEEFADWLCEIISHCSNNICDSGCPMYKCCYDQPSDNIEDWLKAPANKNEEE